MNCWNCGRSFGEEVACDIDEGDCMSRLSVIVPIFNTAKYLHQCMESIVAQRVEDMEIICVNDGSTDDSPSILENYAAADSRIRVIHKENGGLVSARKAGIAEASGKYIGFVDSDDWIEKDMYVSMLHCADKEEVDCVIVGHYVDSFFGSKKAPQYFLSGRYDKKRMKAQIYPDMVMHRKNLSWGVQPFFVNKIFRRSLLTPLLSRADEEIDIGEDQATVIPYLIEAESLYILSKYSYHYRQNIYSISRFERSSNTEEKKIHRLYMNVKENLERHKHIYDFVEQWKKRAVWNMMHRTDVAYGNINQSEFLYPFLHVMRNMKIVLYGAGLYGQRLHRIITRSHFCEIVGWVDGNYHALRELGLEVQAPEIIGELSYDAVVVAVTLPEIIKEVCAGLEKICDPEKICTVDVDLVFSQASFAMFGLD